MRNGNVQRIRVLVASLVAVIAAMADVYIIVNAPKNYILLAVISVVLLIAIFFLVSGKMQLRDLSSQKAEEQYQDIVTSQKACYLQTRKKFRETNEMLGELDKKLEPLAASNENNYKKISGLLDSLMEDQKKVAKLTLSRSKENANAMMNSNDKVMEKMAKVQEVVGKVLDQPENMIVQEESKSEEFEKIEENQQALLTKMQALEDSLNSHMNTVVDKVQEIPGVGRELVEELKSEIRTNEQKQFVMEKQQEEPKIVEPEVEKVLPEDKIPEVEEEASVEEPEEVLSETELEVEPELAEEETRIEEPILEDEITPEVGEEPQEVLEDEITPEIEEPEEEVLSETELEVEPELAEEETRIEEPILEDEITPEIEEPEEVLSETELEVEPEEDVLSETELEIEPEPEMEEVETEDGSVMEEVVAEEKLEPEDSVMEDVAPDTVSEEATTVDANKMMTPEEIAALIAGSQEEELPESMEEPVVEENSVEESKEEEAVPPMPDLSDPNKKMSPEDIAALIANL